MFEFLAVWLFSWLGWNWVVLDLKEIASLIETGAYLKEVRRIARAVRLTIALRRKLKPSVLSAFIDFALVQGSEAHSRLSSYLPKVNVVNCYHWYISFYCDSWNYTGFWRGEFMRIPYVDCWKAVVFTLIVSTSINLAMVLWTGSRSLVRLVWSLMYDTIYLIGMAKIIQCGYFSDFLNGPFFWSVLKFY